MNKLFWKNKKVFITGHTGFKGGWLSLWLNTLGANVSGFSLNPTTENSFFNSVKISRHINSQIDDINNFKVLSQAIKENEPEILFHLAAQPLVNEAYENPLHTLNTNIIGTANILQATRRVSSIKSVIIVTSDKCYENKESIWGYREIDSVGGDDIYSVSKGCAELITKSYKKSYFNDADKISPLISTVRAGNVIGGGDWAKDRLVPDIILHLTKGDSPLIRNPNSVRPWQHVLEPLSGYINLAEKLYDGNSNLSDSWNFGPDFDSTLSVKEIANLVCMKWGVNNNWKTNNTKTQNYETKILRLDSSKAKLELGWNPLLTVKEALDLTISWYKAFFAGENMYDFSKKQIIKYNEMIK